MPTIAELLKPEIVDVLRHIDSITKCGSCSNVVDLDEEGGHIYNGTTMSHYDAHKLLDKVKEGVPYPLHLINKALELTGDLE